MFVRNTILVLMLSLAPVTCLSAGSNNDYQALFASRVFTNLILTLNSSMPDFKDRGRILSSATNAASLAIQSLESNPSQKALYVLAELNMFNLDGALSEEQNCAVLKKGNKIINIIEKLKPDSLNSQCIKLISQSGLDSQNICAKVDAIERRLQRQTAGIVEKEKCDN